MSDRCVEITKFVRPEEAGWEPKGDDLHGNPIYRKPDGTLHVFDKKKPVMVQVIEVPEFRRGEVV